MKSSKIVLIFLIIAHCHLLSQSLLATDITTQDGLTLQFSNSDGSFAAITIDGRSLPLFGNTTGGLSIIEGHSVTSTTNLFTHSFETNLPLWSNAQNDNWTTGTLYYSWITSGGLGNSQYLKLGNGTTPGAGIAFNQLLPVSSGKYQISWYGKSADTTSKYIFCIRLFDANSTDITQTTTPPTGWGYSGTSKAHFVCGMSNTLPDTWEQFRYEYLMPEGVKYITISLRYWNGGDYYVNIDNLEIWKTSGIEWENELPIYSQLTGTGQPNQFGFKLNPPGKNLSITLTYTQLSECIRVDGELQDTSSPLTTRFFKVYYTLPIDATGWNWFDDIYRQRNIDTSKTAYENTVTIQNRKVAIYPFTALTDATSGISLAVPMTEPRIQNTSYCRPIGLRIQFDLAISPATLLLGAGKATFHFILYKLDTPNWGFRSAAKKYYALYPEYFMKRTGDEGCWEYPIAPTVVQNPLDFGFKFYETNPQSSTVIDTCNQLGIEIYHYHEPWGAWMGWGYVTTKPSYDERTARLYAWAADTGSSLKWNNAPRWYTAQAIINSGYLDDSSRFQIDASSYFWHQWSGSSSWNQFWPTNPDMNLPQPNMGTAYKTYSVDYRAADATGGMYVDSILVGSSMGGVSDYRYSHFSTVTLPLTFSDTQGKPIIASELQQYAYLDWLGNYLHAQGKKVMGNIFPTAYRFYAHLLDILGSEVWNVTEPESDIAIRRTLCYQKVNTNLLQFWETRFLTKDEIETYLKHQLFYGSYPGISSAGGGLTYGAPVRYFLHPELYERDRELFIKYIPIIKTLNRAGWEPIPFATSSVDSVRIERFGNWSTYNIYYTAKNATASVQTTTVTITYPDLGIQDSELPNLHLVALFDNTFIPLQYNIIEKTVQFQCILNPNEVHAYRLTYTTTTVPTQLWQAVK
ncbi:MAG: hypothetical protein N3A72_02670 [bacterium]|nr:hypothetical protein [bacterium]